MQQMIDEAGNIWNVDAQGNPVSLAGTAPTAAPQTGPAPFTVGTPRAPEPKAPPSGYMWTGNGALSPIPGGPADPTAQPKKGDKPSPQAIAAAKRTLDILAKQNDLFVDEFSGGGFGAINEYNPFSGAVQEFNDYSNQILPYTKQMMRSPGEGAQSDKDAADYRMLLPANTERDQTNVNRMTNIRDAALSVLQAAGEDVSAYSGLEPGQRSRPNEAALPPAFSPGSGEGFSPSPIQPNGLPDARSARGDQVRIGDQGGVTAAGSGLMREPRLAGVGQELLSMVQAGRPRNEVLAYGDRRFKEVGFPGLFPEQVRALDYAVRMRAANPSKPVTNFVTGWENYEMVPDTQSGAGARTMGAAATWEPGGVPVGNTATHFFNAASGGLPTYLAGDDAADAMRASQRTMPVSSAVGDIGGSIAAMMGINRAGTALTQSGSRAAQLAGRGISGSGGIGGDVLYGATRG